MSKRTIRKCDHPGCRRPSSSCDGLCKLHMARIPSLPEGKNKRDAKCTCCSADIPAMSQVRYSKQISTTYRQRNYYGASYTLIYCSDCLAAS